MHPIDMKSTLDSMVILIDTREQETDALKRRIASMNCPTERTYLESGDYSCKCTLPNGAEFRMDKRIVIERKMNLDEICGNFTRGRERFKREFERLKASSSKSYLLIENASWEHVFSGKYRSQLTAKSLIASLAAWQARYHVHVTFCKSETTGMLIRDLLYYELKELLESGELDEYCG